MPAYNLGEIMSIATGNVGRRDDIAASVVSRMVNEAYFDVFYASDPQEAESLSTEAVVAEDRLYELPSNFLEPISATLVWQSGSTSNTSSWQTLKLVSPEFMDGQNSHISGIPENICFFNSWYELNPSPNSAFSLQLRYRAHPSDLTDTSAVPSLSTPWRRAVVIKTEELLWQYLQNSEGVQNAQMRYLEYVSRIETDRARRQKSSQLRAGLQPSWGLGGRRRVGSKWGSFNTED